MKTWKRDRGCHEEASRLPSVGLSNWNETAWIAVLCLTFFSNGLHSASGQELPVLKRPAVRPQVVISTDIGGSDPDDFQSLVHLFLYADELEIVGLISSPPGAGRLTHIHEVIDAYERDYNSLLASSDQYPTADQLRELARQGATEVAPEKGWSEQTDGSQLIIDVAKSIAANEEETRPLWVLVWGGLTDVAQAVRDDPSIKDHIRIYSIGSWNTRKDPHAREYLFQHHKDLWWIESDSTFRGMYQGGNQDGDLANVRFVELHVQKQGALGELFWQKKRDIKMGDTPSVLYLLRGNLDDPESEHWGGRFVPIEGRPHAWQDDPTQASRYGNHPGANHVNRWRATYLRDWQSKMSRLNRDVEQSAIDDK